MAYLLDVRSFHQNTAKMHTWKKNRNISTFSQEIRWFSAWCDGGFGALIMPKTDFVMLNVVNIIVKGKSCFAKCFLLRRFLQYLANEPTLIPRWTDSEPPLLRLRSPDRAGMECGPGLWITLGWCH
ncbi:MAG: hypothetical protein AAFU86_01210 [Pseudomonadota bacterium]